MSTGLDLHRHHLLEYVHRTADLRAGADLHNRDVRGIPDLWGDLCRPDLHPVADMSRFPYVLDHMRRDDLRHGNMLRRADLQ